ncbi:putative aquaporin SIP2-1 [Apostasia shenzhenica]|uniref:Putative aquaporin SIP2-1 n=1 Tax=Apostasia shenzhenica TaxID=1088818 RepID=A0A2I0AIJ5_9ASPA|nr:putative aquaporin SIP2-1 [Apostasia shenzhenica]
MPPLAKEATNRNRWRRWQEEGDDEENGREGQPTDHMMSRLRLIASDFFVSLLWVWSGSLLRYWAFRLLGPGNQFGVLLIKGLLAVPYLVFFAVLGRATRGGSYNPLIVLCYAISGNFAGFLFTVLARIPAQVYGSIVGVWLTSSTFPGLSHGPTLDVDIHQGAFIEGSLTFMIVIIVISLKRKNPRNSAKRMWISSISKVILHFLGSDATGGVMNPATAFGWAYAQGNHITKEHICVYWLAPIEATLLGVWACSLFTRRKRFKAHHWKLLADVTCTRSNFLVA